MAKIPARFLDNPLNPRGVWDGFSTYVAYDVVSYGGDAWLCLQTNSNTSPTEGAYWMLLAEGGAEGPPGADGNDGVDGVDGANGIDGGLTGRWLFSTQTSGTPSTHEFFVNNSLGSVSEITIQSSDLNSISFFSALMACADTSHYQDRLLLHKVSDPANYLRLLIQVVSDPAAGSYVVLTVVNEDNAGSFSAGDEIAITIIRGGADGSDGVDGVDGADGADGIGYMDPSGAGDGRFAVVITGAWGWAGYALPTAAGTQNDLLIVNSSGDVTYVAPNNIPYTAGTASDWASSTPPTTLGAALDRIATLLASLNGGTGP